ncbi:MAG: vitamin B12-dependent ribonucleotide reductase [Candidatus Ancaeobacter aquaticus]|nr:vitamin B12-dependent ribonucleotide reductase [Candidatus Ancaeobacter aquaticus]
MQDVKIAGETKVVPQKPYEASGSWKELVNEYTVSYIKKKVKLGPNAIKVLETRYIKKDEHGVLLETPEDLIRRVAHNIASADALYTGDGNFSDTEAKFYNLMVNLDFMPNSPTLMNAGRKLQQLSACFVLPIEDDMESIFGTLRDTALVHKSGGGTGFSFSRLRPENDYVTTTYGKSSGPISFMHAYDAATHAVNQGGFRRGANMGILRVDHPDIVKFINCKTDQTKLTNFNISVGVTEDFMLAVLNDSEYDIVNPRDKKVVGKKKAKEVFDMIVNNSWANGEPGIVFLDRLNKDNPTPLLGEIESTNPCGEQPLLPYEACNLGSINLANMVSDGKINYDRLRATIRTTVHFLDNVIDKSKYPLQKVEEMVRGNRKIGLGVMGFADMLILLGVPYNSNEAITLAEDVMKFIQFEGRKKSGELAEERGLFPNYNGSIYDKPDGVPMRNATVTTIAPTGTISIISGCSSGVEPLFAVSYVRNVMDGQELVETHPVFESIAKREGFYSESLMNKIARKGTLHGIDEVPEKIKQVFATSHDIKPEWHIKMQAAFQKHTDNAVSKTVNFSNSATKEDVAKVYRYAFETGCKGVTIYRDGSRSNQVLSTGKTESSDKTLTPKAKRSKRLRPKVLYGKSIQMQTGCGPLYITINEDEQGMFELFNTMGKAGGCAASQSEAIGRLVSLAWRSGIRSESIIKQLIGISCHKHVGIGEKKILSCSDAIAKAVRYYLQCKDEAKAEAREDGSGDDTERKTETRVLSHLDERQICGACPECGGMMEQEGGCAVCRACAYSECG